ncbi:hypothetical protein QWZ16_10630 [Vibrio ostreicida]|uniref:Integrase n=1 Tax=Vibrio ostreicida TaxID=526588 RepID=A0ABT8BT50_9VIBR|nr:hypothetical protein [Vibrio ostreicida]MDN3610156.1 hypothetical protein [Vibrio ostreicida]
MAENSVTLSKIDFYKRESALTGQKITEKTTASQLTVLYHIYRIIRDAFIH